MKSVLSPMDENKSPMYYILFVTELPSPAIVPIRESPAPLVPRQRVRVLNATAVGN